MTWDSIDDNWINTHRNILIRFLFDSVWPEASIHYSENDIKIIKKTKGVGRLRWLSVELVNKKYIDNIHLITFDITKSSTLNTFSKFESWLMKTNYIREYKINTLIC